MTTINTERDVPQPESTIASRIEGIGYDSLISLLSFIFVVGLYVDGWAHNHGRVDQSFFTPWHAIFYSGFAIVGFALFVVPYLNKRRQPGVSWMGSIPAGYSLSLLGVIGFATGGLADLGWHEIFGIEENFEALYSPSHLLLVISMALIVTGPLRAGWARHRQIQNIHQLPALLSLLLLYVLIRFFFYFNAPLGVPWPAQTAYTEFLQLGMGQAISHAALMTGFVLFFMRRWRPMIGAMTLFTTLSAAFIVVINDQYDILWVPIAAGVAADLIMYLLKPAVERPRQWRLFAFLLPAIFYALFVFGVDQAYTVRWSLELWGGAILLSGLCGLLMSFALLPPAIPASESPMSSD